MYSVILKATIKLGVCSPLKWCILGSVRKWFRLLKLRSFCLWFSLMVLPAGITAGGKSSGKTVKMLGKTEQVKAGYDDFFFSCLEMGEKLFYFKSNLLCQWQDIPYS